MLKQGSLFSANNVKTLIAQVTCTSGRHAHACTGIGCICQHASSQHVIQAFSSGQKTHHTFFGHVSRIVPDHCHIVHKCSVQHNGIFGILFTLEIDALMLLHLFGICLSICCIIKEDCWHLPARARHLVHSHLQSCRLRSSRLTMIMISF